ncbi:MAG: patatin-like phospholipase family protein [Chloroflexi bacterium]|nr:patatin-like phospholipase family protein [Chloroflexota bacterium]
MRVAYQAGVVRALIKAGLCFAHADSTSGGIINPAMLFAGLSPVEMCDRWRTLHSTRGDEDARKCDKYRLS